MGGDTSSIIGSVPPYDCGGSSSRGASGVNPLLSDSSGSSDSALPAPGLRPATAGKQFKELGEMASRVSHPAFIATTDSSMVDWVPGVGNMNRHEQRLSGMIIDIPRFSTLEVTRTEKVASRDSGSFTQSEYGDGSS